MILIGNPHQPNGKKTKSFKMFVAPTILFVVSVPYLAKKNLPLLFIIIASLAITLILVSIGFLYVGLRTDRYLQKHDFQLWKKTKKHSLKERMEAQKTISSIYMKEPYLSKPLDITNNIAFFLLTIWTIIFLVILSYIIFSSL